MAGPLTLDLWHRDALVGERWLALHPREFLLLWRLAEADGAPVPPATLLADVWRLRHRPQTNSLAVHVARLRRKLAGAGAGHLLLTEATGAYRLAATARMPGAPHAGTG